MKNPSRRLPLLIAVLASGCLIAACGSSSSSSTSSSAAATTGTAGTATRAAFRTCLRQHGVNLPARRPGGGSGNGPGGPPAGGGFFLGGDGGGGAARLRNNPKFAAAFKACGGARFPRRRFALTHQAIEKFVACVRQHGYKMPSPNFSGNGPVFPASVRTDAKFRTASRSCARLLFPPPPGGTTTSSNSSS